MLLIQRWSWREGEHWKRSMFFFHQIQNYYSIFAYLYKYICFYDQFCFLFSGKFLIFSCVYVFAVLLEVQWVCLYWGLGEFDWFVVLWDWFGWIKDLFFYWFFLWPCLVWFLRKSGKEFRTLKLMFYLFIYLFFEVWFIVGVCEFENVQFIAGYSLVHVNNKACRFLAGGKSTPQLTW